MSGANFRPEPSVLLLPQGRQSSLEEKQRSAFFFGLPGPMQMRLTCRDLSAGLRPAGTRAGFTAATGGVNMRCTNSNVHGKDWSSIHAIIDTAATAHRQLHSVNHCTHRNAAAPLGTEGSFGNWNKLGFAVSLASRLTFVSTMLKEHSVSTYLKPKSFFVSVDKFSKSLPDESSRFCEGVDASYEANILVSVNAS